jgi:O-antigen ligase
MKIVVIDLVTKLTRLIFVLTVIGYPFFGLLGALIDVDSILISWPFRISVMVLSLLVVFIVMYAGMKCLSYKWLWVFWILYASRLLWDILVADIVGAQTAALFFVAVVVLPCYALACGLLTWRECPTAKLLVTIGGVTCVLAVLMNLLGLGVENSLIEQTSRLGYSSINPISLGHVAVTTLIAGLCLTRHHLNWTTKILVACAALAAVTLLILAASRGPVVAFVACALVFGFAAGQRRLIFFGALLTLVMIIFGRNIELLARFRGIEYDESANDRILLMSSAISEFLNHPLLGSAFVEPLRLTYPHNLIIETSMALGILGLATLVLVILRACVQSWRLLKQKYLLLPLLFTQYMIGAQLSGAIWGNASLWAVVVLLVGYPLTASAGQKNKITHLAPAPGMGGIAARDTK